MRIAVVGKGGSGKTTIAGLLVQELAKEGKKVLAIDADINIHLPELLGFNEPLVEHHLSNPASTKFIKEYLKGKNNRIKSLDAFRKTTPPSNESNLIDPADDKNPILQKYGLVKDNISLMVVGTYDEEHIGTACYHNNLAIVENILSHANDSESFIVMDMVAGIDAFSNTLHAQFDHILLVVEPTHKGIDVFEQYKNLGKKAGIFDLVKVIGNKVMDENDEKFLLEHIPKEKLISVLSFSVYLRQKEQTNKPLDLNELEKMNQEKIQLIAKIVEKDPVNPNIRLKKLNELHRSYVSQGFIMERFGDLTNQIDENFQFK